MRCLAARSLWRHGEVTSSSAKASASVGAMSARIPGTIKDALHNSLPTVAARTRAVYGVVFHANSSAVGCKKKRLVAHPDPRSYSLARVMQSILKRRVPNACTARQTKGR